VITANQDLQALAIRGIDGIFNRRNTGHDRAETQNRRHAKFGQLDCKNGSGTETLFLKNGKELLHLKFNKLIG